MHSALEIVAFSHHSKREGVIALLAVALKALDEEGLSAIAVHVDLACALLKMDEAEIKVRRAASKRAERHKEVMH